METALNWKAAVLPKVLLARHVARLTNKLDEFILSSTRKFKEDALYCVLREVWLVSRQVG